MPHGYNRAEVGDVLGQCYRYVLEIVPVSLWAFVTLFYAKATSKGADEHLLQRSFDKVIFLNPVSISHFLCAVPSPISYGVYISQLILFVRWSSHVADVILPCLQFVFWYFLVIPTIFNTPNKLLTEKLLKQDYQYHKLHKTFPKLYRRHYYSVSKFHVSLKFLLRQDITAGIFWRVSV